jgi:hypothetical protein
LSQVPLRRSRAAAAAHLARAPRGASGERDSAFAIAVEGSTTAALDASSALAAYVLGAPDAVALAGAELAAGDGWFGVRSHPRPRGSVVLGGAEVPPWFDTALRDIAGVAPEEGAR